MSAAAGLLRTGPRPLWVSALPLAVWWVGIPIWWALGVQRGAVLVVAVPLGVWLLARWRTLELPPPFVVMLGFLAWVLLSAAALTTVRYGAAYSMRLGMYLAGFVVGMYVWNSLRRGLSPRLLVWSVTATWVWAVLLTFPGINNAGLGFTSPFEWLLQHAGIHNPFLIDSSHPQFSEWDQVYGTARPSPLYAYTNEWGAAIGMMTPVAVYTLITTHHRLARWLLGGVLVLGVVPVVVSLNRGCWISLATAAGYVLLRRALVGDFRPLAALTGMVVVGAMAVEHSPLGGLIAERFAYSNTSTRATLYHASLTMAARSPLIGYGSPQSSAGIADSNDVAVGTHGQLWTVMVSQGFVGVALFVAILLTAVWWFRPQHGRVPEVWLHAVGLVAIVQLAFYEVVPDGICVAFVALAVCGVTAGRFRPSAPAQPSPTPAVLAAASREGNAHVQA